MKTEHPTEQQGLQGVGSIALVRRALNALIAQETGYLVRLLYLGQGKRSTFADPLITLTAKSILKTCETRDRLCLPAKT